MNNEKGGTLAIIIIVAVIILFISFISSTGSSNNKLYDQKKTLQNAYDKSKNGQTLTKQEQRELDSYRKWEKENYGNNI